MRPLNSISWFVFICINKLITFHININKCVFNYLQLQLHQYAVYVMCICLCCVCMCCVLCCVCVVCVCVCVLCLSVLLVLYVVCVCVCIACVVWMLVCVCVCVCARTCVRMCAWSLFSCNKKILAECSYYLELWIAYYTGLLYLPLLWIGNSIYLSAINTWGTQ